MTTPNPSHPSNDQPFVPARPDGPNSEEQPGLATMLDTLLKRPEQLIQVLCNQRTSRLWLLLNTASYVIADSFI